VAVDLSCLKAGLPVKAYSDQSNQMIRKKLPFFLRIAQKVAKSKKAKISTTKLILKTKRINIKPLLKP
jgi:hypothetical protein